MDKTAAFALAGLLLLAGCGQPDSAPTTTEAAPEPATVDGVFDDEVVLGTHSDLTGPIAIWGVGIVNGLRMRFDEANAAGGVHGRRIRLVVEDSQYQIPKAIAAANKLVNRDKIFAMISAVGTQTNVAVMEQPFSKDVPNLFPATGARAMVEPFKKLVLSQMGLYYDEIRAGVRYFVEEKGRTTPCAIYHDTEYGHEIKEAVEDQTAAMGLSIAAVSAHKPTDTEFTAAVLRLKNAGCDLVMVGLVHRDTILVLETARKLGWEDVAWVGNEAAYGQVIAEQKSGAGEGYYAFVPHRPRLRRGRPRRGRARLARTLPGALWREPRPAADDRLSRRRPCRAGAYDRRPRLDPGEDDRRVGVALGVHRPVRQHAELRSRRPQGRGSFHALASARRALGDAGHGDLVLAWPRRPNPRRRTRLPTPSAN